MIGRMSSKAKFDKIISLMRANGWTKNSIKYMSTFKKSTLVPCDIRNIVSHCAFIGTLKDDYNTLFFGGTRLSEKEHTSMCYAITVQQINAVASFAVELSIIFNQTTLKQIQSGMASTK